jgi:hypothetical protein
MIRNAGGLLARIEAGLKERLEEAVDAACLDAIVRSRQACAEPAPAAESASDREEYHASFRAFLERLRADVGQRVTDEVRRVMDSAAERAGAEPIARLMAIQVVLARQLPDYWQRFEATRALYTDAYIASQRVRSPPRDIPR